MAGAAVPLLESEVPLEDDDELAGDATLVVVAAVDDAVEERVVVDESAALATFPFGTVRLGVPEAPLVVEPDPPPPQAAMPTVSAKPLISAAMMASGRLIKWLTALRPERVHAPTAMRAVVQILLCELVTPVAIAEILDGPGQLRHRGREGQQLGHDLELFAGFAIKVHAIGFGLNDHFPARRWRPHPVLLAGPHRSPCYQRARRRRGALTAPRRLALG